MGKVYIGVTAVGGHKLWRVGGKRVAGLGVLGEWVGNGWMDGWGGGGGGPGLPGPYGVAEG